METGIKIGGTDFSGVEDPAGDILKIIGADVDVSLRKQALSTYAAVAEVKNVSISDCSLQGDRVLKLDESLFGRGTGDLV